jgi:hypothetical protein
MDKMEDSPQQADPESQIFTPADRIAELNEIDKVRIKQLGTLQSN